MDTHHRTTVHHISQQVQSFSSLQLPFHIYHGTTSSTRRAAYTRSNTIDTSSLNRVLRITNTDEKKTALVEPNVSMDALVAACLREGLVPLVVMEFPGITVGGGFAGTSGESSSFREGFFDRTVCWVEMVLADGEVVEAYPPSSDGFGSGSGSGEEGKNEDLFYGTASSFGTLGITTCLEVKLREAKPFVQLSYFSVSSAEEMRTKINEVAADAKYEYLDGILFGKDRGVVCAGFLADRGETSALPIQRFTRPWDPWFYIHAEDVLGKYQYQHPKQSTPSSSSSLPPSQTQTQTPIHTELIPPTDYFFRYDRGAFWGGKYSFAYFLMPFNALTRWLLDPFMHTRVMYHALHKSGLAKRYVIQDVGVPSDQLAEFVDYLDVEFGSYPLWICPLKEKGASGVGDRQQQKQQQQQNYNTKGYGPILAEGIQNEKKPQVGKENEDDPTPEFINVGIWGPSPWGSSPEAFKAYNRRLEQKVHSLGGQKCLYAHTYYTEEEFWEIYDRETYRKLREKYHAEYLPDLWEKVRVKEDVAGRRTGVWAWIKELWPLRGVYGVLSVVFGAREYLL
ncbi:FAD binding domain-containing protein [Paecilomyces variotii No. 5]|uniref:Delta(24)-sterol reductase n=1 Tax=Byssochlamys spectabilis (strain No. 5 / NBRC 109023) TaxID=1356009 RepID=V5FLC3_BYSSN|nr:FAD binding domain-containing protein [Paecilomyces variotii No. 5]